MKYFFFFVLIIFTNCKEKNKIEQQKRYDVGYALKAFSEIHKENDTIIKTFEKCISSSKLFEYGQYWKKSDTLIFKYAYDDLWFSIVDWYPEYIPTIMSIQKKEEDKYLVKIAVMGKPEEFNSLNVIYNFYAFRENDGDFKFENVITENLKEWNEKNIENIKYIFPPNKKLNQTEVQKQIEFENNLISKFNFDKINYTYISCNSVYDYKKIRGFDYEDSMFFNNQNGGETFPEHELIFSGNNSEYYPHELVHLYTHKYFKNINSIIDEGFATYLGGSMELDYLHHIRILKEYLGNNKIDLLEYLLDNKKKYTVIGNVSSIKYSVGALLCSLADENNVLYEILDSGKSDEELIKTIEGLFNIDRKDFNSFINEKLKEY
ncbi:hypothetical protein [Thalassobellus citreus]|uniref:hypothetical protein n=1 Tax=Thalassobellus citreus TaxID=3367752 RepID=UPI00379D666B